MAFVLEGSVFLVDKSHGLNITEAELVSACVTLLGPADDWSNPNHSGSGGLECEAPWHMEN